MRSAEGTSLSGGPGKYASSCFLKGAWEQASYVELDSSGVMQPKPTCRSDAAAEPGAKLEGEGEEKLTAGSGLMLKTDSA